MIILKLKKIRNKERTGNKSLYIKDKLVKQIEKIVIDNNTSFNNIIILVIG